MNEQPVAPKEQPKVVKPIPKIGWSWSCDSRLTRNAVGSIAVSLNVVKICTCWHRMSWWVINHVKVFLTHHGSHSGLSCWHMIVQSLLAFTNSHKVRLMEPFHTVATWINAWPIKCSLIGWLPKRIYIGRRTCCKRGAWRTSYRIMVPSRASTCVFCHFFTGNRLSKWLVKVAIANHRSVLSGPTDLMNQMEGLFVKDFSCKSLISVIVIIFGPETSQTNRITFLTIRISSAWVEKGSIQRSSYRVNVGILCSTVSVKKMGHNISSVQHLRLGVAVLRCDQNSKNTKELY